uniref:cyclic pyranopterin monophosphate synthase n=1 Tax=Anopheles maculatus TaxID=74869 RepID=A0A182SQ56_9DIPT
MLFDRETVCGASPLSTSFVHNASHRPTLLLLAHDGGSLQRRRYSSLSHVDEHTGRATMVDVDDKVSTKRVAKAQATVYVGPTIAALIENNELKKGDVLSISQMAAIVAAKKTSDLIPLCHNIPLSSIKVETSLNSSTNEVHILAKVKCDGKTGVEMEALTAVSIAALTVYDMCKAVSHEILIKNIMLVEKTGGKSEFYRKQIKHEPTLETRTMESRDPDQMPIITRGYRTDPIVTNEPFVPISVSVVHVRRLAPVERHLAGPARNGLQSYDQLTVSHARPLCLEPSVSILGSRISGLTPLIQLIAAEHMFEYFGMKSGARSVRSADEPLPPPLSGQ